MFLGTQQEEAILKVTFSLSASLERERESISEHLLQCHRRLLAEFDAHLRGNTVPSLMSNAQVCASGLALQLTKPCSRSFAAEDDPIFTENVSLEMIKPTADCDGCELVLRDLETAEDSDAQLPVIMEGIATVPNVSEEWDDNEANPVKKQMSRVSNAVVEAVHSHSTSPRKAFSPKNGITIQMGAKEDNVDKPANQNKGDIFYRLVMHPAFDAFFLGVILVNTVQIALLAQYRGFDRGLLVQYESITSRAVDTWPGAKELFEGLEYTFAALYTAELLLKFLGLRLAFFRSKWNAFDLSLVIMWYVSQFNDNAFGNPMVLRLARIAKLMRLVRHVGWFQAFDSLHMLIAAIISSKAVLMWSCLLLFALLLIASLVTNGLLASYLEDPNEPIEKRREVYKYFGSFTRSMISMFEMSFHSHVIITRTIVENVGESYMLYFLGYKAVVSLSVMKVITGVFLHETFKVCNEDDELMVIQKKRSLRSHSKKMHTLFLEANTDGNDTLSWEEFEQELQHETVRTWISAMELDASNIKRLWLVLGNGGDGQLTAHQLVSGVAQLKGPAKSLDLHYYFDQPGMRLKPDIDEILRILNTMQPMQQRQNGLHTNSCIDHPSPEKLRDLQLQHREAC